MLEKNHIGSSEIIVPHFSSASENSLNPNRLKPMAYKSDLNECQAISQ